jgi:hypothetical protein
MGLLRYSIAVLLELKLSDISRDFSDIYAAIICFGISSVACLSVILLEPLVRTNRMAGAYGLHLELGNTAVVDGRHVWTSEHQITQFLLTRLGFVIHFLAVSEPIKTIRKIYLDNSAHGIPLVCSEAYFVQAFLQNLPRQWVQNMFNWLKHDSQSKNRAA